MGPHSAEDTRSQEGKSHGHAGQVVELGGVWSGTGRGRRQPWEREGGKTDQEGRDGGALAVSRRLPATLAAEGGTCRGEGLMRRRVDQHARCGEMAPDQAQGPGLPELPEPSCPPPPSQLWHKAPPLTLCHTPTLPPQTQHTGTNWTQHNIQQQGAAASGAPASHGSHPQRPGHSTSSVTAWESSRRRPSPAATHEEEPDGDPGSWLLPGSAQSHAAMWGVNQQIGNVFSPSLLYLSFKCIHTEIKSKFQSPGPFHRWHVDQGMSRRLMENRIPGSV